ncbi:membrane dipeptidase [Amycolatopsis bartoniae]|uniref:Peptidase n=1 Tax=Amycolatopsis bartoniae TaxID=941986 RepID=A0A8H9IZT6_9PSEU|nr:membrane dipeptidase [Amycolatopsis bartoniae]MBB2939408.1 membrane dipeptidase [Amycolatopsis bartoniae]TVT00964.1 diguanylate cyclase [Amycolatopsis bartoniae]GHF83217.1 peptidase [Amycolatopsis bartoniae]
MYHPAAAKPADYESFPYLRRGTDFPAVELSDPSARRSRFTAEADEDRIERLLAENVTISFHDHPQLLPADVADMPAFLRSKHEFTAFTELRRSGLTAVFDNWFGVIGSTRRAGWKWDDLITTLGLRLADLAHQDGAVVARTVRDILDAKRDGHVAFVLGTESAGMIENDLDRIDVLYGLGIRQMGLVYAETNTLGSGQKEQHDGGLTAFGRRAVERMNAVGMLIDVSHASDRTSLDAIEASVKPVAITHAGARAVWPITRMKPDDVLRACAERGGVLGIEAAPHTTVSYDHRAQSIESVMDHFTYAVELMGIEHVAFGPDTLYGDHASFQKAIGDVIGSSRVFDAGDLEWERVSHVDGLENPTENFRNIAGWLVEHGYRDDEIAAVLGGNILRLLNEVWR